LTGCIVSLKYLMNQKRQPDRPWRQPPWPIWLEQPGNRIVCSVGAGQHKFGALLYANVICLASGGHLAATTSFGPPRHPNTDHFFVLCSDGAPRPLLRSIAELSYSHTNTAADFSWLSYQTSLTSIFAVLLRCVRLVLPGYSWLPSMRWMAQKHANPTPPERPRSSAAPWAQAATKLLLLLPAPSVLRMPRILC
jgi:hypothetical protein